MPQRQDAVPADAASLGRPDDVVAKPPLVFAHANGFTGRSYESLLAPLNERFAVSALEQLGHHPRFPVGRNWLALRDELLARLPDDGEPVIGVGHSMGGVLMAMAAEKAPERFRCVVALDPPLMLGLDALAMKFAKRTGLVDRVTPAGRSRGRRAYWPDREAMRQDLRRKGLFQQFTTEAFDDYLAGAATQRNEGGVALAFSPDTEVAIFRHLPDHLRDLPGRLEVPLVLLAGRESDLLTARRCRRLRRHGIPITLVPGGHMFPMEHPEACRRALCATLDRLLEPC
ncbi:alpha/beta hydrolase [Halomonas sp. YLGW01]|uniref:alpha/beta fold hydrolase n=1 Tax=Halomonas sp. YLGW01 TaxID=2773308 RepID=UPI00177F0569|nr:alpha/beta hydrolase [Halomonas sp. YLGW01]